MAGTVPEAETSGATGHTEAPAPEPPAAGGAAHDRRQVLIADTALFSIAVLWGFNFVVIKDVIDRVDPMLYVMLRYIVATAIFAAIVPRSVTRSTRPQWVMGAILGAFYLTALIVQTIGLQYTTPGKSGFITGLSVAMVPFLYWIFAHRSPGGTQILGAIVATVGLGVLSLQGDFTISWGDGLTLLAALFYALHIMTTGFFAPKVPPATLAVTQMATSAVIASAITPFITGLSVAMVPFLYWIFAHRSPGGTQILGAIVATVGLGVLSLQGDFTISWGDGLTLLAALFYALHIMTTGFFAPKVPPATLAVTQMATSAVIASAITPFVTEITLDLPWQVWAAVVWTAVSGTIYAFFLQSWAQRRTTSTHAAVLLCLESVFSALFGIIFGMDTLTWRLITGASLILSGILIIEVWPERRDGATGKGLAEQSG